MPYTFNLNKRWDTQIREYPVWRVYLLLYETLRKCPGEFLASVRLFTLEDDTSASRSKALTKGVNPE